MEYPVPCMLWLHNTKTTQIEVGDVSRMLTTLGRSNKGAAGQMLQAALVNHRESALTLGAEPELFGEPPVRSGEKRGMYSGQLGDPTT